MTYDVRSVQIRLWFIQKYVPYSQAWKTQDNGDK